MVPKRGGQSLEFRWGSLESKVKKMIAQMRRARTDIFANRPTALRLAQLVA